jgi:hypothetical protein
VAEGVVTGLVNTLTGPVIQVIRAIAGAVALVSQVLSVAVPWFVSASPSLGQTRFAVGDEPDIAGSISFTIDNGGLDEWPADVADCAAVAGAPLPDLTPKPGTPVTLQLVESPIDLVVEGDVPSALNESGKAVLQYVTNREPTDDGPVQSGTFLVTFALERQGLEGLGQVLAGVLVAALPPVVSGPVAQLLGGQIDALVQALDTLTEVVGTSLITVIYHEQKEPTPTVEVEAGGLGCPAGEWQVINLEEFLQAILAEGGITVTGSEGTLSYTFAADGTLSFTAAALVICSFSLGGGSVASVAVVMTGGGEGTWVDQGTTLLMTAETSDLDIAYELSIDGTPLGGQELDLWDFEGAMLGSEAVPYTCADGTLALTVPGGKIPLVLGPA